MPDKDDDHSDIWKDFNDAVNMSPAAIEKWLKTDESRDVGWTDQGESESVGHKSGKRIVEIKRKEKASLTDGDYEHMRKVIGYVHRHLEQGGTDEDKEHSRWRYSLMNWGHDPMKH